MDYSFQGRHPASQLHALVADTNNEELSWYADSVANTQITNELGKLNIQQPFQGSETVIVGDRVGLNIQNFGLSIVSSSKSQFLLKDILHCPKALINLISIKKFSSDNDCYFVLTSTFYLVKDNWRKATLLEDRLKMGCIHCIYKDPLIKISMSLLLF